MKDSKWGKKSLLSAACALKACGAAYNISNSDAELYAVSVRCLSASRKSLKDDITLRAACAQKACGAAYNISHSDAPLRAASVRCLLESHMTMQRVLCKHNPLPGYGDRVIS